MDAFEELERMALNAAQEPADDISPEDIARWQMLFSYTYEQAVEKIDQHNLDFTRTRLTDSQWDLARRELEAQGYDRSSWEHELIVSRHRPKVAAASKVTAKEARKLYLLKLEAPLDTPTNVGVWAGLSKEPECMHGEGDSGEAAQFCIVNGSSRQKIQELISLNAPSFHPTFIPYKIADKDFSSYSSYPTLGVDSTLPQFRASDDNSNPFEPMQDQYPIWYFFYGTLAQKDILARQIGLSDQDKETVILHPASITNGRLGTWGGKYKALIDANGSEDPVRGLAYLVNSKEQEDALRLYETDAYEVVRCNISLEGGEERVVKGCTFRFAGMVDGK